VTPTSQTDSNLNPEQPVALSLLSVEERLLLINASIPLQGLSRLQKLVLAVSMQVFCTSMRAPFELTRAPPPPSVRDMVLRFGSFLKAPKLHAVKRMPPAFFC
jgi:hypothetical protein